VNKGILTLDLSTKTGWARWRPGEPVRHGVHRLPSTGPDVGRFLVAFDDWFRPFLRLEDPAWVVFEAPILTAGMTNIDTARKLMSMAAFVEVICRRADVAYREVNNASVRKHFCGTGRARDRKELKQRMMDACAVRGWQPQDDNAADALGVLDYSAEKLRLPVPWQTGVWFQNARVTA
jgi:Holliday junction resolvasome RuvABC endonuclease subunit